MSTESGWDPDGPGDVSDGLFGLGCPPDQARVVVLPVPFEATTSFRRGTRWGPQAVLEASVQVELEDEDFGAIWRDGLAMLPIPESVEQLGDRVEDAALQVIAAGGALSPELKARAAEVDAAAEQVQDLVLQQTRAVLRRGGIPIILGGDHASPFGGIQAALEACPQLGVLHIDAHADLREAYEGFQWSHASIFYNVMERLPLQRLVQVGLRDRGARELQRQRDWANRVRVFSDRDLSWSLAQGRSWAEVAASILDALPDQIWISLDIDGLDPSLCPHTGTPVPGGLSWHQITTLLRMIHERGLRVWGADLCEVAPGPGPFEESWDANVGARLLYKLCGLALRSQSSGESGPRPA